MKRREETDSIAKKARKRFNAVDILIAALFILILFFMGASMSLGRGISSRSTITVRLNASDAEQFARIGYSAEAETKVYDSKTGELIGILEEDYDPKQNVMVIRLNGSFLKEEQSYYVGQSIGLAADKIKCGRAEIIDISRYTEDG